EPSQCEPLPCFDSFDLEAGKGRLGMDGSHSESPAVPGTEKARAFLVPGGSTTTPDGVAGTPSGHGAIRTGDGTQAAQRVVPAMGSARHGSPRGMDSSR